MMLYSYCFNRNFYDVDDDFVGVLYCDFVGLIHHFSNDIKLRRKTNLGSIHHFFIIVLM